MCGQTTFSSGDSARDRTAPKLPWVAGRTYFLVIVWLQVTIGWRPPTVPCHMGFSHVTAHVIKPIRIKSHLREGPVLLLRFSTQLSHATQNVLSPFW